jgi:hypothetical protein
MAPILYGCMKFVYQLEREKKKHGTHAHITSTVQVCLVHEWVHKIMVKEDL